MQLQYFDKIKKLIEEVEIKEEKSIEEAINLFVEAIENNHSIFTFGASHAGIMSEEMYYRAGGLVLINPIFGREIMLDTEPISHTSVMERMEGYGTSLAMNTPIKEGDVVITHSVSGRNPVTLEIALEAKKRGAKVIAITNVEYSKSVTSRHSSNKRLFEIADVVIDNHGDIGDACGVVEGIDQKVGPTSTVICATIVNSIILATCEKLVADGMEHPPIFYSANLDGGDELNRAIYEKYKNQIFYKF